MLEKDRKDAMSAFHRFLAGGGRTSGQRPPQGEDEGAGEAGTTAGRGDGEGQWAGQRALCIEVS